MNVEKSMKRLARRQCASFDTSTEDRCLFGYKCEPARCPYFRKSVLPADPEIERAYRLERGQADEKDANCRKCTTPFERESNRQIYCEKCGIEAARLARNKRMREYRLRK